jgi:hypothetical protein
VVAGVRRAAANDAALGAATPRTPAATSAKATVRRTPRIAAETVLADEVHSLDAFSLNLRATRAARRFIG